MAGLPYALLFLEWEARFPQEWTRHAKSWGTKQSLIRDMARTHQDEAVKATLTDLVEIVVRRAYRCKDREYVRVARAVDSADVRGRLDRAVDSDSPWARCRPGMFSGSSTTPSCRIPVVSGGPGWRVGPPR
ncbi:hypothetical protein ACFZCF_30650 [Streptomyces sp. NPDC007945]|uniref:hypothetical protein n=1 Tax=Streptomyces sp. NPDC007945 TaxID=3364797 RepID=UPI0036EFA288